jgi:hypothetical protein
MGRILGVVGWMVILSSVPARADSDPTDGVLQKFFPGRDLSKARFKFVDEANGVYAVGDGFEVLRFGYVRTTNVIVVQQVRVEGVAQRAIRYTGERMVLSFDRPIRSPCDLRGNKIAVITTEK